MHLFFHKLLAPNTKRGRGTKPLPEEQASQVLEESFLALDITVSEPVEGIRPVISTSLRQTGEYLLLGGHGLGTHSVLGLALISAMRSLYLALSEVTVRTACGERERNKSEISEEIQI